MRHLAKPDNLTTLRNRLERIYGLTHARARRSRNIYREKYNLVNLPEGVAVHQASTGRSLVDNLADQIRTDQPKVEFDAKGSSQKAQQHKELMQMWGSHIIKNIAIHVPVNPFDQVKRDLLIDAAACVKFTVDVERFPMAPDRADYKTAKAFAKAAKEWKEEAAHVWPFLVRPLDIMTVYPCPTTNQDPLYFLEVQRRYPEDVMGSYGVTDVDAGLYAFTDPKKPRSDAGNRTVEWLEYWSDEHYIVEVDGERIIDKPNPYGAIPYAWEWNGLGRLDESGDPAWLGESMLEPIAGELEEEVRVKTAMGAQWQFHVFPRLITTLSAEKARGIFMKGPGGIISVTSMQDKPEWLVSPQPNETMFRYLLEIKQSIAARFPPSLMQRPSGVEAALHQALLLKQALTPLQPIKSALNKIATKVVRGLARQVASQELTMNVFGHYNKTEQTRMVGHQDFTDFNFNVSYEATDPAEDDRRLLTGLALLRVPGVLSLQTFREKFASALGISHFEEEQRIAIEQLWRMIVGSGALVAAVQDKLQEVTPEAQEGALAAAQGAEQFVPGGREREVEGLAGVQTRETGKELL